MITSKHSARSISRRPFGREGTVDGLARQALDPFGPTALHATRDSRIPRDVYREAGPRVGACPRGPRRICPGHTTLTSAEHNRRREYSTDT